MMKLVAILSTTILPLDGIYSVNTVEEMPIVQGVPNYIGHPDTKKIVEGFGAVEAPCKLFTGLMPGESALCLAIKQGMSNRGKDGFTSPHQGVTLDMLSIRILTRIE